MSVLADHFDTSPARRMRLRVEFVLYYVAAPLVMAVFLPPNWLFPVLGVVTLIGLVLLGVTPGFRWRELLAGSGRMSWALILGVAAGTAVLGYLILGWTRPEARFALLQANPQLMMAIALFYPFLSALPQEIVFRPLFFRRFEAILPRRAEAAIVLNAAVFSFAHLMYWSWVVAGMTFAGGLVFAHSHRMRGNFPEAVVAHSLAGIVLFAVGMGAFFYSGNVSRPF
jgi:hypothetical protein